MPYTRVEIAKHAKKLGRSARTLRRWVARGANLDDPESIRKFLAESEHKKTNIRRFLEARGLTTARPKAERARKPRDPGASSSHGNGDTAAPGRRGAQHALVRLEQQEEESFRRLQAALRAGDPIQVAACQDFWLKCSEVLRRLNLAIETSRREAETQVPLRVAQDTVTYCAEWLRIGIAQFLSAETNALMAFQG